MTDELHGDGAGEGDIPRRRSRAVMYSAIGVAVVIGLFVAVLASSKPAANGGVSGRLIGQAAPAISGPLLVGSGSGGQASLAGMRGRWVLVTFAASDCVPCRQETPQLQDYAAEHAGKGDATVLAVAFEPADVGSLTAYLRQSRVTWTAVNDPSAEVAYGVTSIPQSFLVDPSGRVVAKFFGPVTAAQVDGAMAKASTST